MLGMITGLRKRPHHSKTEEKSGKNDEDDDAHHAEDDANDKVFGSTTRNNNRTNSPAGAANDPTSGSKGGATITTVRTGRGPFTISLPAGLVVLVHVLAIVLFVLGFVWRMKLHTGQECDMTYSYRLFLEIQTKNTMIHPPISPSNPFKASLNLSPSSSSLTSHYRLYKFVDQRDPRYQDVWKDPARHPQPLRYDDGAMWCRGKYSNRTSSDLRIVLYIPGHWGSYEQSRSVGAHGLQLTRQQDSPHHVKQFLTGISQNSWTGNKAAKEGAFIYDVYAVDFAEQGTALHGEFLLAQSHFVARVVEQLVNSCHVSSITLVAHSMGGYVARLTPILHPETRPFLHDIITLATPHANPLYAWDETVYTVHQRFLQEQQQQQNKNKNETLIVSLSGGLRDEMIAPLACDASLHPTSISTMTTKLIPRGNLGMDHQAIVWCHDLLSVVRKLIWVLSVAEDLSIKDRLHRIQVDVLGGGLGSTTSNSPNSYSDDVQELQTRSQAEFGYWKMVCVEAAMLYNLPLLVALFGVIGSFHCAAAPILPRLFSLIVPVVACGCGWMWSDVHPYSVVLLILIANTVHTCVLFGIGLVRRIIGRSRHKTTVSSWWRPLLLAFGGTFLLAQLLGAAITYTRRNDGTWSFPPLDIVFYACSVVLIYASVLKEDAETSREDPTQAVVGHNPTDAYAALVVVLMPFLIAGQVVLMAWEGATRASTWYFLLKTGVPIVMVSVMARRHFVMVTTFRYHRAWQFARSIVLSASTLCCCPWVLPRGTGFRLATILILIAWTDIVLSLFLSQVTSSTKNRRKR